MDPIIARIFHAQFFYSHSPALEHKNLKWAEPFILRKKLFLSHAGFCL